MFCLPTYAATKVETRVEQIDFKSDSDTVKRPARSKASSPLSTASTQKQARS